MTYDKGYFEGGEYESYEDLEDKTKSWYSEVLSLAGIESGQGKALDVGCAYGYGLEILSDLGFEPFGLDISEHAAGKAKRRTGAEVVSADVQESIPLDEKFDLVTCVDTLEHLENPSLAISNVYDKLESGGKLVASTPNLRWWRNYLGLAPEDETHVNVWPFGKWEETLREHDWLELKVRPLQTIPLIWRVFDRPAKFRFPWGEIVHIKAVK